MSLVGKFFTHFLVATVLSSCCVMYYDSRIGKQILDVVSWIPPLGTFLNDSLWQGMSDSGADAAGERKALAEYSDLAMYKVCMIQTNQEEEVRTTGFRRHGFNEFVSDKIGMLRKVPDTRNPVCKSKKYAKDLPTASIVMCFYNEAWSTLLRSVHSVLQQTPDHLLKDIILFDDSSSHENLGTQLESYVKSKLPKVKLVRSKERLGLIRARMAAARHATGEVLVFLDSHIEAVEMWLEPLLDRVAKDRRTVTVPVVDTIEPETFKYTAAKLVRGGFTWSLLHNWEPLPSEVAQVVEATAEPFMSPTMPGGLFAMDKKYFHELGEYDAGMDIWGGENVEISFRIWQCGGRLEIVPCSHVGHVYRRFRPYSSPDGKDTTVHNTARVAEVWLDEYKKHYYNVMKQKVENLDFGDVTKRQQLRQRLNCKSFKWFLETIHPEQGIPGERHGRTMRPREERTEIVIAEGMLRHTRSGLCVQSMSNPPEREDPLHLDKCSDSKAKSQTFVMTEANSIKMQGTRLCLEALANKGKASHGVKLSKCHSSGGDQLWLALKNVGQTPVFYNPALGKCLAVFVGDVKAKLRMDICTRETTESFKINGLSNEYLLTI